MIALFISVQIMKYVILTSVLFKSVRGCILFFY